ncbi:hypothetical protein [Flavobacterium granuli]|uniref:Uncharacterized protein n=1 Tax=Flavobacterium granuli TaxID=280093 RepID=A0A1M5U6K3_9FLAO|nr:hypothetical protein [Flavobacterium granuli]PRZ19575.1 hypothetical protein BC624_11623 [Flavobacterium granuli]SHH58685.1 hypothetical protein SAMN05443373_11823 [Flavobacterium granuli]
MQYLNNFLTGTENLFKLLFINGIVIILIGLFYPLQKRDELQIKISDFNFEVNLLNNEIYNLKIQSENLKDSLKNKLIPREEAKLRNFSLKQKAHETTNKTILQEHRKEQIKILEN